MRADPRLDGPYLVHELGIDVQATCGIDDEHVVHALARCLDRCLGDGDRIIARFGRVKACAHLFGQTLQLQDRRGSAHVRADEQHPLLA